MKVTENFRNTVCRSFIIASECVLSAEICQCIDRKNMHGVNNIQFKMFVLAYITLGKAAVLAVAERSQKRSF
jgi:hypothetical protein